MPGTARDLTHPPPSHTSPGTEGSSGPGLRPWGPRWYGKTYNLPRASPEMVRHDPEAETRLTIRGFPGMIGNGVGKHNAER
jgi:hypothetical protein